MADTEISSNLNYLDVRTVLPRMLAAGILECERRQTVTANGWVCVNPYYRPAGSDLPWPGEPPTRLAPPDPDAFPGLSDDAERVLAAASIEADEAGLLNMGPLREACGLTVERVRAAIRELRRHAGWPYRWRFVRPMPEDELLARIAVATDLKRRVVAERGPTGETIADCEFDLAFGEEARAG